MSDNLLAIHVGADSMAALLFEAADERVLAEFEEKTGPEGYGKLWSFCQVDINKGVPLLACDAESLLRALTLGSARHGVQGQPIPPFQVVEVQDRTAPAKEIAHRIVAAWKDGKFVKRQVFRKPVDYFSPVGQKRKAV